MIFIAYWIGAGLVGTLLLYVTDIVRRARFTGYKDLVTLISASVLGPFWLMLCLNMIAGIIDDYRNKK